MKAPTRSLTALAALGLAIYMAAACSGSESLSESPSSLTESDGANASGGGGPVGNAGITGTGGGATTSTGTGGVPPPTEGAPCDRQVYQCGDLIDNDGDGLIDALDPDCLGPCDDNEGS
jgi:hypothetical protein